MRISRWIGFGVALMVADAALSLVLWNGSGQNNAPVAFAQGAPTATPSAPSNQAQPAQGTASDFATTFWNSLAAKLGVGVDTLKNQVVAAEKDAIEQAVTNGKLTRAQADQLEQRLSANDLRLPFFGGPRGGFGGNGNPPVAGLHGGLAGGVDTLEAIAKALNLKPADLTAQLQSGKTLADLAKSQNVDQATVKQAIIDAAKTRIQREVQDGIITQAQADQELSNLTPDRIDLTRPLGIGDRRPGPASPGGALPGGTF